MQKVELVEAPVRGALRVAAGLSEGDREVLLGMTVALEVLAAPEVLVALELRVPIALEVSESVALEEPVTVVLALGVPDCVDERVFVTDELLVPVALEEDDPDAELELVPSIENALVPECEEEIVLATELEGLPVVLIEPEGLELAVEAGVGAGEALRSVAMLRPRMVMDDTAASASPDSHSCVSSTALVTRCVGMSSDTLASKKQLAVEAKRSSGQAKE